jgi:hypothetical protein
VKNIKKIKFFSIAKPPISMANILSRSHIKHLIEQHGNEKGGCGSLKKPGAMIPMLNKKSVGKHDKVRKGN